MALQNTRAQPNCPRGMPTVAPPSLAQPKTGAQGIAPQSLVHPPRGCCAQSSSSTHIPKGLPHSKLGPADGRPHNCSSAQFGSVTREIPTGLLRQELGPDARHPHTVAPHNLFPTPGRSQNEVLRSELGRQGARGGGEGLPGEFLVARGEERDAARLDALSRRRGHGRAGVLEPSVPRVAAGPRLRVPAF